MVRPGPGDSFPSILSNISRFLADKIPIARGALGRVRAAGTFQGPDCHLDEMTEESQTELQVFLGSLEWIQRGIDTIITREQARGSNHHVYNIAITAAQPGYRENHTNELTPVVDSMVDRINNSDSGSVPPDQHPTTNWTTYNEENSQRIEWPPVSRVPSRSTRRGGRGGAHNIRYRFQCTVAGCNSKPLEFKSKLRDHHSVHNPETFSCPLCPTPKMFRQFRSLVRHRREKHESQVDVPQVDGSSPDGSHSLETSSQPLQNPGPVTSPPAVSPQYRPTSDHDAAFSGEASESAGGFFQQEWERTDTSPQGRASLANSSGLSTS